MDATKPAEILMVDDDDLDFELFQRTMRKERIANPLHHARNGVEALDMLRARISDGNSAPLVVLMDINMPMMSGIECLRAIRGDEQLKSTVVFIMTTSDNDRDMLEAHKLNVAGYLVKNDLGTGFLEGIVMLESYWTLAELPTG